MRNLRRALWAQENCCWLKRYTLANRKNKVESLTHACASLCSFKHGYLSLQKYSLCKNTPLRTISKIVESILNRQADYISSSIRLAAYTSMRRIAPLDVAAGQPGPLLVIRWLTVKEKRHVTWHVFFLTGSYLSFQAASSQVLSTYKGLTTVFGMGTGGSP